MASRWRRRRMCVLVAEMPMPAALRRVDARGAIVETNARPALGDRVSLSHPEAGTIDARVDAVTLDAVSLRFACSERSVAFALAAIAADMSRPA
ncbi:hypothetical protein [Sphingosinicella ginsenosidimutans]|uniref:PilZ domain-containing protein n=1 Tax=Allosphingosinicella ginsenosidimutans TaxID=1176539 RepID=A0A5C6TUZ1_9SPHN|nr:hypothetical protein [Sphingosinicella ginsenosidimutans]TXC64212.1 hypothetical protein FRZ32_11420 [Sphingosinicella ginsenosidimutans]